jgi:hypothetical protein
MEGDPIFPLVRRLSTEIPELMEEVVAFHRAPDCGTE